MENAVENAGNTPELSSKFTEIAFKDPGLEWMLEPLAPLKLCTRCLRGRRLPPIFANAKSLIIFNPLESFYSF